MEWETIIQFALLLALNILLIKLYKAGFISKDVLSGFGIELKTMKESINNEL